MSTHPCDTGMCNGSCPDCLTEFDTREVPSCSLSPEEQSAIQRGAEQYAKEKTLSYRK